MRSDPVSIGASRGASSVSSIHAHTRAARFLLIIQCELLSVCRLHLAIDSRSPSKTSSPDDPRFYTRFSSREEAAMNEESVGGEVRHGQRLPLTPEPHTLPAYHLNCSLTRSESYAQQGLTRNKWRQKDETSLTSDSSEAAVANGCRRCRPAS